MGTLREPAENALAKTRADYRGLTRYVTFQSNVPTYQSSIFNEETRIGDCPSEVRKLGARLNFIETHEKLIFWKAYTILMWESFGPGREIAV